MWFSTIHLALEKQNSWPGRNSVEVSLHLLALLEMVSEVNSGDHCDAGSVKVATWWSCLRRQPPHGAEGTMVLKTEKLFIWVHINVLL